MLHSREIVRKAALRVRCNGHVLELRDIHGHFMGMSFSAFCLPC